MTIYITPRLIPLQSTRCGNDSVALAKLDWTRFAFPSGAIVSASAPFTFNVDLAYLEPFLNGRLIQSMQCGWVGTPSIPGDFTTSPAFYEPYYSVLDTDTFGYITNTNPAGNSNTQAAGYYAANIDCSPTSRIQFSTLGIWGQMSVLLSTRKLKQRLAVVAGPGAFVPIPPIYPATPQEIYVNSVDIGLGVAVNGSNVGQIVQVNGTVV